MSLDTDGLAGIRDTPAYEWSYIQSEIIVSVKSSVSMAIAQLETGRDKKYLQPVTLNQPITRVCFFLCSLLFFQLSVLSISSFLPVYSSIHLSLSPLSLMSLALSLSLCLCSQQAQSCVLTCASNTWASLLIRLRSVLCTRRFRAHTHSLAHIQTHRMHTHTQTSRLQSPQGLVLVNYSVCVGGSV